MGCGLSSDKASTSSLDFAQPPKKLSQSFQPVEEKVKEVLSETPKWKPKTTTKSELPRKPHQNIKTFQNVNEKKAFSIKKSDDNSKICSLRKTMATTTTEETGKRVNRSPPVKLHKNCSFSGDTSDRREGKVRGSRNFGSVRLVQCRDQVGQKMVNGGMRRRCDPIPGDNSFRRSRSPATRVDTVFGRSPSARRTNRLPVERTRTRTAMPEKVRRETEIPAMKGKRVSGNDLLENPLVSLECFIFI